MQIKIVNIVLETSDTKTFFFQALEKSFTYQAGQFITLILKNLSYTEVRRSYSLSTAPTQDEFPAFTVKKISNGLVSSWLHKEVAIGDILETLLPSGQFLLPPPKDVRDIFLFGGGSGITPLFAILKAGLFQYPSSKVTLIYANCNEKSIIFREQIVALAEQFPNRFNCLFLLSQGKTNYAWLPSGMSNCTVLKRRLGNQLVEDLVRQYQKLPKRKAHFYLCGPKGLMLKSQMTLKFMGYQTTQIHREVFTIKTPISPVDKHFPDSVVHIQYLKNNYAFALTGGETILQAAERAGFELPYSCKSGSCTTCAGQCTVGEAELYTQEGVFRTKQMKGLVFTCVAYPLTEKVVIKIPV